VQVKAISGADQEYRVREPATKWRRGHRLCGGSRCGRSGRRRRSCPTRGLSGSGCTERRIEQAKHVGRKLQRWPRIGAQRRTKDGATRVPTQWKRTNQGEIILAKFLIKGSYTAEGAKALVKEGGSRRKEAVEKMLSGLGGKIEAFYFALGDSDVYVIVDVPDTTSGAALSLAVNASGTVRLSTILLMTPEEVDAACKKTVNYRAPGQ
jgi:uncharacterized protein with GYD domain